ncbi:hypothetical protein GUITHDRAFT_152177 [Guillardia theta CCMP2712]|uniref:DUF1279 domain-containing protein n=1 Tax=Guillardia theta (strain CCMP2712) TaxID=905079 RepID=L1JF57_GUITC|nr:hypothetical protein GUITHDRAFT_152177 [Guillardia theta CCMP2712]EKX47173.1 hypothetical protein GUITHDRAFT_152177 [Guillardia theta CCMP2712]|eukprot:XP_005834153.1 hypothetical protein GUITHDRAFT_152177 [Guillardia theta CCMP2712]
MVAIPLAMVLCLAACPMQANAFAFPAVPTLPSRSAGSNGMSFRNRSPALRMVDTMGEEKSKVKNVEEVTKKWGLEAGLFTALTNKNKEGPDAKQLLAKYGSAYLLTSISLSLVSFGICYVLVDNGVDVAALLSKVGITANGNTETAGTVAIAYAAHKAASPIRFPPTVALTPLTAKYLFNKKVEDSSDEQQ